MLNVLAFRNRGITRSCIGWSEVLLCFFVVVEQCTTSLFASKQQAQKRAREKAQAVTQIMLRSLVRVSAVFKLVR